MPIRIQSFTYSVVPPYLERAAKFLWVRYYAPDEDNDQTEVDLIASDGSCAALASVFADIRAEAMNAERERCAKIIEQACGPDDNELAKRAADAFNSGTMRRPAAERIKDLGEVISAAIRAADDGANR
jgi:hypothetical protein